MRPLRRGRRGIDRGAGEVVAGVGGGGGGVYGAARGVCDLLGGWTRIQDSERGVVERTQGDAVQGMGLGNGNTGGSVLSKDTGSDGEEPVSYTHLTLPTKRIV